MPVKVYKKISGCGAGPEPKDRPIITVPDDQAHLYEVVVAEEAPEEVVVEEVVEEEPEDNDDDGQEEEE